MTSDNRRRNIADELARAQQSFRAVRLLVDGDLANDAVSRAYYAVFHVMRAALLSRGVEAKTHSGTLRLFNQELTSKGVLPSFNKLLTGLQGSREAADYEAAVVFTIDDARSLLADAETFESAVLDLLAREGWIAPA